MKNTKIVIAALGLLCLVAVFLPFVTIGPFSASLWAAKSMGKPAPTYIALLGSLAMLGLAGLGVSKGALSRGLAIGAAIAGLVVAVIAILQFSAEAPFMKVGGIGAKILVFGGLAGFVAGIVGTVKPERA